MTDCTNCGDKCPFVKQGFCQTDSECPHYMESWWQDQKTGQQKLVKDCSPKRLLLDSQTMFNRSIAIQGSIDKLEFRLSKLESLLEVLISQSKNFIVQNQVLQHEIVRQEQHKAILKLPENPRGER